MEFTWPVFAQLKPTLVTWSKRLTDFVSRTPLTTLEPVGDGDLLEYDGDTSLWRPRPKSEVLIATIDSEIETLRPVSGWIAISETWSSPATVSGPPLLYTVTVPSGATTRFYAGDKIRLSQDGGSTFKYFYVVARTSTQLTLCAGTEYALTSATISNISISRALRPIGFPGWFNWTPTFTGFSADPYNNACRFSIEGTKATATIRSLYSGTSNASTFTISAPVTAATVTNQAWGSAPWYAEDNSVGIVGSRVAIYSGASIFNVYTAPPTSSWTASGGKRASFTVEWEI